MKRFQFGQNWTSFARSALTSERVDRARQDFSALLNGISVSGKTFLDIGFGQGLGIAFAAESGAARVIGVDIDKNCCQAFLYTRQFFPKISDPEIVIGSILDSSVVSDLRTKGPFDIVHSWGVLHHTGNMWQAIDNAASLVKNDGHLVIALYARHWTSPLWKAVKWTYVHSPRAIQQGMALSFYPIMRFRARQLGNYQANTRGMEFRHDLVDWIGGYPYEYAKKEEVIAYLKGKGFAAIRFKGTAGMTGCHEYVFQRSAANVS